MADRKACARAYTESLVENFIRDYPLEFLNETLTFASQQRTIGGFRPDLIFRDIAGRLVIVEVQLNTLDRGHLYRTLEYRDLLMHEEACEAPRVILFCNDIRPTHRRLLPAHRIACVMMPKDAFLARAMALDPSLTISESTDDASDEITVKQLLAALQMTRSPDEDRDDPDARVFWFEPGFPFASGRRSIRESDLLPLQSLPLSEPLYFNDWGSRRLGSHEDRFRDALRKSMPAELIVAREPLERLMPDRFRLFDNWLDLLVDEYPHDGKTELVLGHRGHDEIYGYERYIRNRIRRFVPIWDHYASEAGYDLPRIRADLEELASIAMYAGKYRALEPIQPYTRVEVQAGPGPLAEYVQERREIVQTFIERQVNGYGPESLERYDRFVRDDHRHWATVRLQGVDREVLRAVQMLVRWIWNAKWNSSSDRTEDLIRAIGLAPSRPLRDIPSAALQSSATYFFHLKRSSNRP